MGRLFGTDGARGIANSDLTCELAMQIGRAAAQVLTKHTAGKPKLVIGKDPRVSSDMLESALCAGICSVGADAEVLGVVPTPAVAYLVGEYEADAGIMISASHNPVEYNGIKLFSATGFKLSDEIEDEIEALILDHPEQIKLKDGVDLGRVHHSKSAVRDYVDHIKSTAPIDLCGLHVVVDCANGSASATAALLFHDLGAKVRIINDSPDGMNINDNCGSTHLESLIYAVKNSEADLGVAFDGDADRCLAVDENGSRITGDHIIAICAAHLKAQGKLTNDTAVITVMSNFGMRKFAKDHGINLAFTTVGDRYVLEEMLKNDYSLGGEDSGHIIFRDLAQTGDGQLTAVQLLAILKESGKTMSELSRVLVKSPQVAAAVPATAAQKERYQSDEEIQKLLAHISAQLGDTGRLLVRPSGTEALIRIMLEGSDYKLINDYCEQITNQIKERINA